jgi:hypothetical protein
MHAGGTPGPECLIILGASRVPAAGTLLDCFLRAIEVFQNRLIFWKGERESDRLRKKKLVASDRTFGRS